MKLIFVVHLLVTWTLIGFIWTIQQVHYPLFDRVGAEGYTLYQRAHMSRISMIVLPLMVTELITALILIAYPPVGIPRIVMGLGAVGIFLIWGTTLLINMPQHTSLSTAFDAQIHRQLVLSNWIRTTIWSCRGMFLAWILWKMIKI